MSGGKHCQPQCTYESPVAAYHTVPLSSVRVSFVPASLSIQTIQQQTAGCLQCIALMQTVTYPGAFLW